MLNSQITKKEEIRLDANVGEDIGYELGAKMIKDFSEKYGENSYQFIGKNIINEILVQPGCVGLNIFKGIDEKGNNTYVITGVKEDGQPLLEVTAVNKNGNIYYKDGIVADRNITVKGWYDDIF